MPAKPNTRSADTGPVLVWNRGKFNQHGHYRVGNVNLNVQRPGTDGKPIPKIHPIRVGLDIVPRLIWEESQADAKRVTEAQGHHMLTSYADSGRLTVVDLNKMPYDDACEAIDQTANKQVLKDIAEGKLPAPDKVQEHAIQRIAKWGSKENSKAQIITEHFASYTRAV